jgi:hypothetical protein
MIIREGVKSLRKTIPRAEVIVRRLVIHDLIKHEKICRPGL